MTQTRFSEDFLEYSWRLRRLHALIRIGEGDSDAAETIRDDMDDYYRKLSVEENELLDLLSADLNSIGEDVKPRADSMSIEEILGRHDAANSSSDPEELRHLILDGSDNPGWNAFVRFLYWSASGDLEAARPFAQFAVACMEQDVASMLRQIQEEVERLEVVASGSSDPEADESRERNGYLQRTVGRLQGFLLVFEFLKLQLGSLYDVNDVRKTESSPSNIGKQINALMSSMSMILRAA